MHRRRVLFPEPERPSRATVSPSRRSSEMSSSTGSGLPSGETNVLVTWETSMMVVGSALAPGACRVEVVVIADHLVAAG